MVALEIVLAEGGTILAIIQVAALLLTVALVLTQKKPKLANLDDALQSSATRGAFIPLLIGRHRVGPVFAFVDDSATHSFTDSPSQPGFGKGGGSAPTPPSYWEDSLHILCVGPGSRLMAIFENGKTIFNADISPDSHPSGSSFTLADGSVFKIYWGFSDDPSLPLLAGSTRHGLTVRYPLVMKVLWCSKNLGQSRQWPRLEYEVECPCYSQIAQSSSEMPINATDSLPTWESAGLPYLPRTDRVQLELVDVLQSPSGSTLLVLSGPTRMGWGYGRLPLTVQHPAATLAAFRQGGLVKVAAPNPGSVFHSSFVYGPLASPTPLGTAVAPATVGIGSSSWTYFIIRRSYYGPRIYVPAWDPNAGSLFLLEAVYPNCLVLEVSSATGVPVENQNATVPGFPPPVGLLLTSPVGDFRSGWARPVETAGFDGVNPVHMMDQLLFAKFPYGAGRSRSMFDSRSIEKAAVTLQEERIRGSIQVKDGEGVESVVASILQDCGIFMPWDPQTGLFLFKCIRHEDPADAVDLPPEMILKSPEVVSVQGSRPVDVIAFTYRDRDRNYREEPLVILDDGQISLSENQKARKVPIEVTTDGPSAGRLIPRRQQEVLANLQAFTFETNHASQMAFPGIRISAKATEGDGFIFRVVSVKRDVDSSKVVLKALLDCFDPPALVEDAGFVDTPADSPLPGRVSDASSVTAAPAVEVPRMLAGGQIQILFPAGRLSDRTSGVAVWASRDGSSYSVQGSVPTAICGILDADLPIGPCYSETASIDTIPSSIDFDSIEDLSLSLDSWRAGRQLLIIGSEICFLKSSSGDSLVGLIRGRLGTLPQAHPAGTPFCVVLAHQAAPISSAMFLPGKTISYKLQAVESSKVSSVDDQPPQDITIQGLAYKPAAPTAVRLANLRPDYSVSDDITIRWNWHSNEFPRTGLGMQTLGAATGTSNPRGHFTIRILDGITVVLEGLTADPLFSLDVADRGTLGLDALSSWVFEVTAVEGSFSSAPVSLTLYPV